MMTDFLFVGGVLAIDFVNTEVIVRGKPRDLLAAPRDLAHWWASARTHHPDADMVRFAGTPDGADLALLASAKALRANLRQILTDLAAPRDLGAQPLAALNQVLKLGHPAVEQLGESFRPVYHITNTLEGPALLPIALSAHWLLTAGNLARVHQCHNPRCILFFYDETRSATRHWCSLGCMNRARSIQRYQAAKAERARQDTGHET
jgi:predicted RNA-binding Zn ribbon-like protein